MANVLDKVLQFFVVKDKRFFPLYIEAAENIVEAADLLIALTEEVDNDARREISVRIKEHETKGDKITDTIIDELLKAFVTPFDRDDIHQLAQDVDVFLDSIRDSGKKIVLFQPKDADPGFKEMALAIRRDAGLLLDITRRFENMRDKIGEIDSLCDQMIEIEHSADNIYSDYMSALFHDEKDAIELVKKKNIIQTLEDTCDLGKDISDTVRNILVKLS